MWASATADSGTGFCTRILLPKERPSTFEVFGPPFLLGVLLVFGKVYLYDISYLLMHWINGRYKWKSNCGLGVYHNFMTDFLETFKPGIVRMILFFKKYFNKSK